jgi:hypothetical protein
MTLKALIDVAYGDGGFDTSMSVREGPDWANGTVYTVEGVAAAPATPRQMLPRGGTSDGHADAAAAVAARGRSTRRGTSERRGRS